MVPRLHKDKKTLARELRAAKKKLISMLTCEINQAYAFKATWDGPPMPDKSFMDALVPNIYYRPRGAQIITLELQMEDDESD